MASRPPAWMTLVGIIAFSCVVVLACWRSQTEAAHVDEAQPR